MGRPRGTHDRTRPEGSTKFRLLSSWDDLPADRPRRAAVFAAALGTVAIIGFVDHGTGQLALSIFYILPIVAATWLLGTRAGVLTALAACLVWLAADAGAYTTAILFWNAIARYGVFLIIVFLLAEVRSAWRHQRRSRTRSGSSPTVCGS